MHVEADGVAIFKVIETGELVSIKADDLIWDSEMDGDRQMGNEITHLAEFFIDGHPVTWRITEYPVGVENYKETDYSDEVLSLVKDINYWLEHDRED